MWAQARRAASQLYVQYKILNMHTLDSLRVRYSKHSDVYIYIYIYGRRRAELRRSFMYNIRY